MAGLAAEATGRFGSAGFARCAGLRHDLGKNARDFHARLGQTPDARVDTDVTPGRVDHSSAGAIHALDQLGPGLGLPLAIVPDVPQTFADLKG